MSCASPDGGIDLVGVDLERSSVVCGRVLDGDVPAHPTYVRLLDASGEFVAEVKADANGEFRFFAAPGSWRVRALGPGRHAEAQVDVAGPGRTDLVLPMSAA